MFPIRDGLKQGDAQSPLLLNFGLGYAIRRVQVNQTGLKIKDTHQLLVYSDDVNMLGRSVHTIKEKTEASSGVKLVLLVRVRVIWLLHH